MRAVAFSEFGAAPALTDLPVPQPGPGEVLVRVRASSVNGFDLGVLGGYLKGTYEYEFPVVLGKDFAGHVESVGDGADFHPGDDVFGVVMRPTLGQGGFAEYVVVNAQYGIARIPDGLDHARAGALGLAGTAARNAVDAVQPTPGETVLISGATGGVGAFAVQLAATRGAEVIATARSGAEAAFVTAVGATHAVHPDDLKTLAPVHAAIHLAGDGATVARRVTPGGRFATTVHHVPDDPAITSTAIMADPNPATLAALADDVVAGRLRVPLAGVYDLADTTRAVEDFTRGTVGKLAVTI
ncbi:NADP-dependent oxidoreductase [Saccharothrix sp.]|uniref:NADP-dependent oxidoreductase n=1 Tax=Saccharothrix sp. TaxID=1873460 RepID=UPI002810BC29|nr:NADP-dependent oxidoreductase [Saccharothrix sp.]